MSVPNVKHRHLGQNIKRICDLKGIKQDTLAIALDISQQAVSKIEQSENIDDDKLQKIAEIIGVTPDAIKSFNEDAAINNFNNFHDNSTVTTFINAQFNPVEKIIELYERLLEVERKRNDLLDEKLRNAEKAK